MRDLVKKALPKPSKVQRRVNPDPSRGGARGYDVQFRDYQLEQHANGEEVKVGTSSKISASRNMCSLSTFADTLGYPMPTFRVFTDDKMRLSSPTFLSTTSFFDCLDFLQITEQVHFLISADEFCLL